MTHDPERPPVPSDGWLDDEADGELRAPTPVANWDQKQLAAAARFDELVGGVLVELGQLTWGPTRGRSWQIVAEPAAAAWRLYHLVESGPPAWRFEALGVRATIDPHGELVAFQVDNGAEFLALVDTTAYGLRRGLLYLVGKGLPQQEASQAPFAPAGSRGPLGFLRALVSRFTFHV